MGMFVCRHACVCVCVLLYVCIYIWICMSVTCTTCIRVWSWMHLTFKLQAFCDFDASAPCSLPLLWIDTVPWQHLSQPKKALSSMAPGLRLVPCFSAKLSSSCEVNPTRKIDRRFPLYKWQMAQVVATYHSMIFPEICVCVRVSFHSMKSVCSKCPGHSLMLSRCIHLWILHMSLQNLFVASLWKSPAIWWACNVFRCNPFSLFSIANY